MSATVTDEARDLLDSLTPPSCEWRTHDGDPVCGAPAAWLMRASCGDSAYFCEPHKQRMHAQLFVQPVFCARHPELGRILFDWIGVA